MTVRMKWTGLLLLVCMTCSAAWAQSNATDSSVDTAVRDAILAEVKASGLDKKSEVQRDLDLARQAVLIRVWEQQFVAALKFSDEQRAQMHKELLAQLGGKEYLLSHILVRDEAAAQALLGKIAAGATLESLVAEHSLDAQSKAKDGQTAWANKLILLPELRNLVDQLKLGEVYAKPVKTAVGWHVVKLVQSRDLTPPTQEQSKTVLEQLLVRQALGQKIETLRAAKKK